MAAANPVGIQAALQRLGFSIAASISITAEQDLDSLEELAFMTDEKVENLCKVLRRPGGTIPNPDGGNPLPNPGHPVSQRAEDNLQLACYLLRFRQRTSRATLADMITLENVRSLKELKAWEKDHTDVEKPEINPKDWPKTIESIEEYLRGCLGVTKIPLAYVVREATAIPGIDPVGGYSSRQDELIARSPIVNAAGNFTPTYLSDRTKVWELLSEITREKECWTYVRPAQKTRDGRLAFERLKGHYLGENNVDNMSSQAENTLTTTSYTGEKRNWNFEKYVRIHVDQHSILEGLVPFGYAGIDERSKVRHLISGIKTSVLDNVKTRILSDARLRSDFNGCVNLYQDFIKQSNAGQVRDVNIAALTITPRTVSTQSDTVDGDVQPDMSVEDRYYKKKEYNNLSKAKKLALKIIREKRGHNQQKRKRGGNDDRKDKGKKRIPGRNIKAVASANDNASESEADDDETDNESESEPEKRVRFKSHTSENRKNPALRRK